MDQIYIILKVPSMQESLDLTIPRSISVNELVSLIHQILQDLPNSHYVLSHHEILCLLERKMMLAGNEIIANYQIKNGDTLVLI